MKSHVILCLGLAFCFFKHTEAWCRYEPNSDDGSGNCHYEGNSIPKSGNLTLDAPHCVACACSEELLLHCCSTGWEVTTHSPECEIINDGCDQKAVLKSDHSEDCPQFEGHGN